MLLLFVQVIKSPLASWSKQIGRGVNMYQNVLFFHQTIEVPFMTRSMLSRLRFTLLLSVISFMLVVSIILFPQQTFDASLQSLTIWWTIVFPALLPFLIIAEMMLAYGLFHFIGTLLEPLMKRVFRLPGASGPVLAIGLTIGYPIGTKLTKRLLQAQACNEHEGHALLSLSHMASPLLMMNVIAVGFLQQAKLGLLLITVHVVSTIILGLWLRRNIPPHHTNEHLTCNHTTKAPNNSLPQAASKGLLYSAIRAMQRTCQQDGRSFGKLLGDAVQAAIQTLLIIGGYMIIFAVFVQVLMSNKITNMIHIFMHHVVSKSMIEALLKGWFEIHNGAYAVATTAHPSLLVQTAVISGMLAWSGLCMHTQVVSIIHGTRLRYSFFLISRIIHTCLAMGLTIILWQPLNHLFQHAIPSFGAPDPVRDVETGPWFMTVTTLWATSAALIVLIIAAMLLASLLLQRLTQRG